MGKSCLKIRSFSRQDPRLRAARWVTVRRTDPNKKFRWLEWGGSVWPRPEGAQWRFWQGWRWLWGQHHRLWLIQSGPWDALGVTRGSNGFFPVRVLATPTITRPRPLEITSRGIRGGSTTRTRVAPPGLGILMRATRSLTRVVLPRSGTSTGTARGDDGQWGFKPRREGARDVNRCIIACGMLDRR